ncbi:mandelate racemase [Subtercola sp. Z020]|uniref:mandelate racemase/muconate lactonizing enzyme family protein n=1 Tax=Subtercola sp. Z020 TaxID=2080582 RepID=UPI000CE8C883|nr:mandelate racemase/muconate lactonizing enzyme family protein [Subtercola sp. Z020]PPF77685.1 mandelate racemase [Subtercola sp. Z020]
MTRITAATVALVDLEVETERTDATQSFVKQETILVTIATDEGLTGTGYSYTIGTGGRSVTALLRESLLPLLIGRDSRDIEALWRLAHDATHATTVGPLTSLALAAIDTALWDLKCLRASQPLWRMAGGASASVPLYDTENGWLHLPTDELVAGAIAAKNNGWGGTKIKVGKPSAAEDVARLRAVRDAVGPSFDVMTDANQALTAAEAIRRARAFEGLDLFWFEEPLPADDVSGHVRLAEATPIPVAVGESLYSVGQFRDYLHRGAASIVQPDVARIGGITPWLKVAHLAEAYNVDVCPHFLMELHVSLVAAVPNGRYVEFIPQLRAITRGEIAISAGRAEAPDVAGLGIDWNLDALDDRRVE